MPRPEMVGSSGMLVFIAELLAVIVVPVAWSSPEITAPLIISTIKFFWLLAGVKEI